MYVSWRPTILAGFASALLATAQAPSYAPELRSCPSNGSLVTSTGSPLDGSQQLFPAEQQYIQQRRSQRLPELWRTYLANDTGYNVTQIVANQPRMSIAISGGGLRASLYGAGALSALDSRNETSLGGLVQLADYLSGLSGGSWTVSSFLMNDMTPTYELATNQWLLDLNILAPGGLFGISDNRVYFQNLIRDVQAKGDSGAPISIVDVWGRALAMHFYNGTTRDNFYDPSAPHDEGLLWSSIKLTQNYQNYAAPMPIVVATSRQSEEQQLAGMSSTVIPLNNTVYEFTPFTYGSFDYTLRARVPLEYLGTFLNNTSPQNSSACTQFFDNAGFVIGTSAALFNAVQNGFRSDTIDDLISTLLSDVSGLTGANYSIPLVSNIPNSFYRYQPESGVESESYNNQISQITDGGEDGQNVPLNPLLVKARQQDILLALDSSADTDQTWPNGTSLLATADRAANYSQGYFAFPPIPATQQDFVDQGLNIRPTFFGCDVASANISNQEAYPIVVYMPNAPPPPSQINSNTYFTNTSTFQLDYALEDVYKFLDGAHANILKGGLTREETDQQWPVCLKCAVVDRARQRANIERSDTCQACMQKYCWTPDIASQLVNITQQANPNGGTSGGGSGGSTPPSAAVSLHASKWAVVAGTVAVLVAGSLFA
ncbi:hypothetical protein OIO90_001299 [Microbotryomycetes sp. JL221]|nr:hypothetical protein OIO90_001299 [Microbotryomycetes sp. JL221]